MKISGLLTVKDLSSYLSVSPSTIYRWTRKGEIPFYRRKGLGIRFNRDKVDGWLRKSQRFESSLSDERRAPVCDTIPPKGGIDLARVKAVTLAKNGEFLSGTVYWRRTKKGNRWCLNFQVNGKRVRKVIPLAQTREEALVALREEIQKEFDREYSIRRKKEKVKFREFKEIYLTNYAKLKKRSWRSDEKYINSQLIPFFGNMELSEISPLDIHMFMAKRQQDGVKNSTINRELTVLKTMLSLAIKWEFGLTVNPVEKGNYFSEECYQRKRVLSLEEEASLFKEASPHLRPILTCALSTGMRYSEILGLKWECVDLEKKRIFVTAEASKSAKSRIIPINETLLTELKSLQRKNPGKKGFVFLYEDPKSGKRRPVKTIRRAFVMACRRAEIKNLHFHDLRHTAGTRLIEKGADPISVRDILGHSKLKTTEVYLHSNLARMEAMVRLLDKPREEKDESMSPECHQKKSPSKDWRGIPFISMN